MSGINDIFAADLVELLQFSNGTKESDIDSFSKYGWIFPLCDKRGKSVAEGFETLFKSGFFDKNVQSVLDKFGVKIYTAENEEKSGGNCRKMEPNDERKALKIFVRLEFNSIS